MMPLPEYALLLMDLAPNRSEVCDFPIVIRFPTFHFPWSLEFLPVRRSVIERDIQFVFHYYPQARVAIVQKDGNKTTSKNLGW
jgi:hypothetical protein